MIIRHINDEFECIQFVCSAGTPNRLRRGESSTRGPFISQNSSVTEAPSDEVEQEQEVDDDAEPARVESYVILILPISNQHVEMLFRLHSY